MGLFASKEEKAALQEREARANAALSRIIVFPGCMADLETLLNSPLRVADTGWTHEKGLFTCSRHYEAPFHRESLETREYLAKRGIVALIHAVPVLQYCESYYGRYGVPVALANPQS